MSRVKVYLIFPLVLKCTLFTGSRGGAILDPEIFICINLVKDHKEMLRNKFQAYLRQVLRKTSVMLVYPLNKLGKESLDKVNRKEMIRN